MEKRIRSRGGIAASEQKGNRQTPCKPCGAHLDTFLAARRKFFYARLNLSQETSATLSCRRPCLFAPLSASFSAVTDLLQGLTALQGVILARHERATPGLPRERIGRGKVQRRCEQHTPGHAAEYYRCSGNRTKFFPNGLEAGTGKKKQSDFPNSAQRVTGGPHRNFQGVFHVLAHTSRE